MMSRFEIRVFKMTLNNLEAQVYLIVIAAYITSFTNKRAIVYLEYYVTTNWQHVWMNSFLDNVAIHLFIIHAWKCMVPSTLRNCSHVEIWFWDYVKSRINHKNFNGRWKMYHFFTLPYRFVYTKHLFIFLVYWRTNRMASMKNIFLKRK